MSSDSTPLDWLMATQSRGVHPGLERMERLLVALENPEKRLRCLHVAGTNGKGSVCAIAESILRSMGIRTGLYTSPHLVEFSERIRINGENIADAKIDEGIERLREITKEWSEEEQPTFFELVTALAFDLLDREGCEVVVLETGLGGRLDATNMASKLACAITPIALDHSEWLGETLGEIAREKAGILREGIPVVIAPQQLEVSEVLAEKARVIGAPCEWITTPISADIPLGLAGSHQRWNAAVARSLIRAAGFEPTSCDLARGLCEVSWPGRFQKLIAHGMELILDGAHNLHAVRQLVITWREEYGVRPCRLIFGALADKDPDAMLSELMPLASEVCLVPVASPRSTDPWKIAAGECFSGCSHPIPKVFGSLREALGELRGHDSDSEAPVLLTGSLFLVGEALSLVSGGEVMPRSQ
ncbi:MAG: bifunctional folylpolyglutamate synthase/dihydrofolate synthase [Chthoniobacterales bacterium]|nr:bifunctional folylpolyglutamate synthase/dihydrofolate synthase [Chthoniobacterales bacterium]